MTNQGKTLYERLGGVNAIATVVDDFIDRIQANPVLQANDHITEGYKNITIPGLKYLVTEQICAATGGPQAYTGREMSDSHAHLAITEAEWAAFASDFVTSLNKFKVPESIQKKLLDIVGTTHDDIVTA